MVKVNTTYCDIMAKDRQYDGRSRPSNDVYRQRWDEIFNKKEEDKDHGTTEETDESTD